MLTPEEKEELFIEFRDRLMPTIEMAMNQSSETTLLMIPQVVGANLQEITVKKKLTDKFYADNKKDREANPTVPDYIKNSDIIKSVVNEVENKNPGIQYADILEMSKPMISERIKYINSMDMTRPEKPTDLNFKVDIGEL